MGERASRGIEIRHRIAKINCRPVIGFSIGMGEWRNRIRGTQLMRKNGEVREESHGLHPINNWVDGVSGVLYGGGKAGIDRNCPDGLHRAYFWAPVMIPPRIPRMPRPETSEDLFAAKLITSACSFVWSCRNAFKTRESGESKCPDHQNIRLVR